MNRFLNSVVLALRNLSLHKLRSTLTVLGLIFGVSSVVAMLAIAEGASAEAQRQIAELGATNVIIRSIKPMEDLKAARGQNDSFIATYGLTHADYDRIVETIPTVVKATPIREFRQEVRHYDQVLEAQVVGAEPSFLALTNQKLDLGRFIEDTDLSTFANVVVLGHEVAEKLFPFGDPLAQSVRVGESHFYRVIGVTAFKAPSAGTGSSIAAQDFNKQVYVPLTTNRVRFGEVLLKQKSGSITAERVELSQITVTIDKMDNVMRTANALKSMLKQFHAREDYGVTIPLELLEKAEATKRIFNLVLGSIASISLLVGGIGIMNIMLATVTERTREIGIRRALGAKRRDITFQFLIETAVISATGGFIGVVLGVAAPPIVANFSGIPVVIQPWAPVIAFGIALVTGVTFGLYPARRAAHMDPVEALRTE
jgi:putative ABC transport system permease protein